MSDFSAILGELGNMSATRLSGVFSGENAFWFGDEYSFANMDSVDSNNPLLPIGMQFAANASKDALNFTFENGAHWTYFGVANSFSSGSTTVNYTPKRISKITLRNGGIINLFDDDIKRLWQEMGLDEVYPEIMSVEHDYVRIGTLLGDGGIFRLNLNAEDKSKSDLIFVENAERDPDGVQPHTHYIEPYDLKLLHSITPDNTLIFALVNSTASHYDMGFKDKQNLFGESLFDYELEIASRPLTEEDLSRDELNPDKRPDLGFVEDDFQAGGIDPDTVWYIRRVTLSESAAAMAMTGAGFASYNAAIEMDRRDLRLTQTVRSSQDPENGLWVRLHHGQNGIDHQYEWDRTGVTVGVDRKTSDVNRVGVYFSYTDGDTDFLDVDGSGDMQRYELAIFDTVEFGSHYLDFVGRIAASPVLLPPAMRNTAPLQTMTRTMQPFQPNTAICSKTPPVFLLNRRFSCKPLIWTATTTAPSAACMLKPKVKPASSAGPVFAPDGNSPPRAPSGSFISAETSCISSQTVKALDSWTKMVRASISAGATWTPGQHLAWAPRGNG